MTEEFINYIRDNNIEMVVLFLKTLPNLNKKSYLQENPIGIAAEYGHFEITELLLKYKAFNPSKNNNWAIRYAAKNGHTNIVSILLKDKRVNPTDNKNWAIRSAFCNTEYNNGNYIVDLLWKDKRVKKTLKKDDIDCYNELNNKYLSENINGF
jgi:ankyrin repeat protein